MKKQSKPKLPPLAEERAQIEKTRALHLSMIVDSSDTIRVLPVNIARITRAREYRNDILITGGL